MLPSAQGISVVDLPRYERDVLGLHSPQTEKDLDDQLVFEAHSLGLDVQPFSSLTALHASKPLNSRRLSAESAFSSSTGFTSILSRSSQETQVTHMLPSRMRSESRPSLYHAEPERSYDSTSPSSRSSISLSHFSPPTSRSPSTTHLPQESSNSFKRGLGRLSRLRKPDVTQGGEDRPSSSSSRRHPVIAGLAQVLARKDEEEPSRAHISPLDSRARSPDGVISGYSTGLSTPQGSLVSRGASPVEALKLQHEERMKEQAAQNFIQAMQFSEFQDLRHRQERQRDRFLAFGSAQQPLLDSRRDHLRAYEMERYPHVMDELEAQHSADLAKLEDRHVASEMDLREAHELEQRNCHIALRHMEAYCRGIETPGQPVQRNVSEQDRRNLERQYWLRDHLSQKQESAINVLREQQAKQLRVRSQKHDSELAAAQRRHEADLRSYDQIYDTFDAQMSQMKERLAWKWELATRIWKIHAGLEGVEEVTFPLPHVEWPLHVR